MPRIDLSDGCRSLDGGGPGGGAIREALLHHLPGQRWFAAKDRRLDSVTPTWCGELEADGDELLLIEAVASFSQGADQRYFVPVAVDWNRQSNSGALAEVLRRDRSGVALDAALVPGFARALIRHMLAGSEIAAGDSVLRFRASARLQALGLDAEPSVRRLGAEQSNSSVLVGERVMLKIYRRLERGIQPEIEIGRFLTEVAGFAGTPPWLGSVERIGAEGEAVAYAAAFGFIPGQGDAWRLTLDHVRRDLAARGRSTAYDWIAGTLGRRTAQMHRAFAIDSDDAAFAPEPVSAGDVARWLGDARAQVAAGFATLAQARTSAAPALAADIEAALALRPRVEKALGAFEIGTMHLAKSRLHGDFHLGQVLLTADDAMILDFEGEPARSLDERRAKGSPLKDVAGMLRSFDYAAWAAALQGADGPAESGDAIPTVLAWRDRTCRLFLAAYRAEIAGCPTWPRSEQVADRLLRAFALEKLFYEIRYEAANRPTWLTIPVRGILELFRDPVRR
ncbi:MAG: putative maltokinase [Geminicoccaceae bacterium]